jgi:hypothetical protein
VISKVYNCYVPYLTLVREESKIRRTSLQDETCEDQYLRLTRKEEERLGAVSN